MIPCRYSIFPINYWYIFLYIASSNSGSSEAAAQHTDRRGSKLLHQENIESDPQYSPGHFEVRDLSRGRGVFYISQEPVNLQHLTIKEDVRNIF